MTCLHLKLQHAFELQAHTSDLPIEYTYYMLAFELSVLKSAITLRTHTGLGRYSIAPASCEASAMLWLNYRKGVDSSPSGAKCVPYCVSHTVWAGFGPPKTLVSTPYEALRVTDPPTSLSRKCT